MSRSEDVPNDFWDEHDGLSTDALLVLIWSTTNTRCGMAGVYRCPRSRIAEGRVPDDGSLQAALDELEE